MTIDASQTQPGGAAVKPHRFDIRSLKRAMVVFTLPGHGQTIQQENIGAVDEKLRRAIKAARKSFDRVMYAKESE